MPRDLNQIESIILRTMRQESSRWWHTFDIIEACRDRDNTFVVDAVHIPPHLRELEHEGLLESRSETRTEQQDRIMANNGIDGRMGRPRRLYRVTNDGQRAKIKLASSTSQHYGGALKPEPA